MVGDFESIQVLGTAKSYPLKGSLEKNASPDKVSRADFNEQAELARNAGISFQTLNRIENGYSCRLETQRRIILALGLKLSEVNSIFPNEPDTTVFKQ